MGALQGRGADSPNRSGVIAQRSLKTAVVNLVTGGNLLMGVTSIILASFGHGRCAVFCLIAGMILDAFDGLLARRWQVFSKIGAELDSLADLTSFVVANSVLLFFWFHGRIDLPYQIIAGAIFTLCGAFRLARFNVEPTSGGLFQGMPTTGVALLIAAIYLTHPNLEPAQGLAWQALLGLLMVSSYPYPKFGTLRRVPTIYLAALGFYAVWNLPMATAMGCLAYVASGPLLALRQGSSTPGV
jgi:CDP-diacylglycerol--serine O-phosphatidyltransferase